MNGWKNRETWLVNLHFGDAFFVHMTEGLENNFNKDDDVHSVADEYKSFVNAHIEHEISNLSTFLMDLIDVEAIDWYELADTMMDDLKSYK